MVLDEVDRGLLLAAFAVNFDGLARSDASDGRVVYVDGANWTRQFTSINEYQATQVRCGDVDGDNRPEVVLNSGQVLDAGTGDVEWEDEPFFARIELLDIDGDGIPEVLTENPGNGPLKVFNVGYRREVRLQ